MILSPKIEFCYARNTFQASNCLLSSWNLDKFGNSKLGTEGIRWVSCFKRFFWWDELQDSNCLKLWFTDDCLWSGFLFKMGPKSRKFPKEQLGLSENFHDYRREGKILLKWWFKIIFTISNIGLYILKSLSNCFQFIHCNQFVSNWNSFFEWDTNISMVKLSPIW